MNHYGIRAWILQSIKGGPEREPPAGSAERTQTGNVSFRQEVRQYYKLFFLMAIALAVRVVWMLLTDNLLDGDAPCRLYEGINWARHPMLFPVNPWLPGHYWFLGTIMWIFHDVYWIPRIAHLIFGVLVIIPFYLAVKEEFDESIAFNSSIVLALFPYHVYILSLIHI